MPDQNPRVLRTSTGEFYDSSLFKDRDPQAALLTTHHNLPYLSALAVHIGVLRMPRHPVLGPVSSYSPAMPAVFLSLFSAPLRLVHV